VPSMRLRTPHSESATQEEEPQEPPGSLAAARIAGYARVGSATRTRAVDKLPAA